MASITLRAVEKHYGSGAKLNKVIHGVDAAIADGEFIVIVGPSGCGKSTLLRMVAGLEEITGGQILIGERVVNDLEPAQRDIAMVFQNYALYPHMTVRDNMAYGLKIAGRPKGEIEQRVAKAAKILELGHLLERKPRELSGGQRQRVAMGRAIVRQPQVFLFDEPLSNLDAKLRVQMRAEIKALHHRLKTTTVYVTHDQVEAMTMADKIVVMNNGTVEQVGKPLDLYDRPANLFVAGFIGSPSMNFLKGTLRPGGKDMFLTVEGIELPLPEGQSTSVDRPAIYGIRPEHLSVDDEGVPLVAEVVEPTGSEVQILGRVGQQPFTGVFRERLLPEPGMKVGFRPMPQSIHLFDGENGQRLN